MSLRDFSREEEIFRDESVLRDSHTPDTLLERNDELAEYQNALQPVINGAPPKNIFVYGQTGVGKTLSTSIILEKLASDADQYDDLDIEVVNVVCKSLTTSYQVSVRLLNELRPEGEQIAKRGHAAGDIYDMLWEEIESLEATHVLFVLDEVDSIGTNDDILYQLPRCNSNGNVEGTYVGVIGISNDFTFRDNLSGRVKDSLADEEIHFPPYDAEELESILEQRAEKAFVPEALGPDVVQLCAAFAARESGSARLGLRILYKAGDLARQRGDDTVREPHVRDAVDVVEKGRIKDELERLPTQSHLTLFAVLDFAEESKTPVRRKRIYERYCEYARELGVDVKTNRTIHDRLSDLTLKGFLDVYERNEGIRGGNYYTYEMNLETELVREVLQNDERVRDLFY